MGNCYNSTVLKAPIVEVWNTIRDFHDLSWGEPLVTSVQKIGEKSGTEPGAVRILNDAFTESLLSIDPDRHTFSYSIDDGPGPVARDAVKNYVGTVKLYPVTDTRDTYVEWRSSYESADPQAVGDFCNPIYAGLLQRLKNKFS